MSIYAVHISGDQRREWSFQGVTYANMSNHEKNILFVLEKVFCWSATQNYIHNYVTGQDPVNSFPFLVMVYLEIFLETSRYFYWRRRYIDKDL